MISRDFRCVRGLVGLLGLFALAIGCRPSRPPTDDGTVAPLCPRPLVAARQAGATARPPGAAVGAGRCVLPPCGPTEAQDLQTGTCIGTEATRGAFAARGAYVGDGESVGCPEATDRLVLDGRGLSCLPGALFSAFGSPPDALALFPDDAPRDPDRYLTPLAGPHGTQLCALATLAGLRDDARFVVRLIVPEQEVPRAYFSVVSEQSLDPEALGRLDRMLAPLAAPFRARGGVATIPEARLRLACEAPLRTSPQRANYAVTAGPDDTR